jgi:hypothetical protein
MATDAIRPSSPFSAVGQITAFVIAAATAIRAIWVFASLFWKEDSTALKEHSKSQ